MGEDDVQHPPQALFFTVREQGGYLKGAAQVVYLKFKISRRRVETVDGRCERP